MNDYESEDGLARHIEARCRFYRMQCDCNPISDYTIEDDQYTEQAD